MSFAPDNFTVWAEIPVTDIDRGAAFYNTVLKTDLKMETEPQAMAVFPTADPTGVAGHLYVGMPSVAGTGPTVHLTCPDALEDTLGRVKDAGGTVVSDVITIECGRFAYCQDPDGNSIGMYSFSGGSAG